jgi:hypothetical protein
MMQETKDVQALQAPLIQTAGKLGGTQPAEPNKSESCNLDQCFERIEKLEGRIARLEEAAQPARSPASIEVVVSSSPRQLFTPGR